MKSWLKAISRETKLKRAENCKVEKGYKSHSSCTCKYTKYNSCNSLCRLQRQVFITCWVQQWNSRARSLWNAKQSYHGNEFIHQFKIKTFNYFRTVADDSAQEVPFYMSTRDRKVLGIFLFTFDWFRQLLTKLFYNMTTFYHNLNWNWNSAKKYSMKKQRNICTSNLKLKTVFFYS